jgi:hypothetical protein
MLQLTRPQQAIIFPHDSTWVQKRHAVQVLVMEDNRIYNRALTPTEVKALYDLGTVTIRQN